MVVLHDYWRSSSAYRVRIALALLDLPHQRHRVDLLAGEQTAAENVLHNPQGLVPSLEIDGITLTQSLAIIEYLDETRDAGFLPRDPIGRARVRALSMAVAMEIQPVCNLRVAKHAVTASQGAIVQAEWMRHFIREGLVALEKMLPDGSPGHCYGESVTMADICLVPQVYNARRWQVALDDLPRICTIDANLARLPAFVSAYPQDQGGAGAGQNERGRDG